MAKENTTLTTLDFDKSFHRLNGQPFDATSIFDSLAAAESYAKDRTSEAYVGQYIAVKTGNSTYDAYIIADTAGNLRRLSAPNVYFTEGNKGLTIKNTNDSSPAFLTFIGNASGDILQDGSDCGIEFYANAANPTNGTSNNTGNLQNRIGVIYATVDADNDNTTGNVDNSICIKLGNISGGSNVARFHTGGLNVAGEIKATKFNNATISGNQFNGATISNDGSLSIKSIEIGSILDTGGFIDFHYPNTSRDTDGRFWLDADKNFRLSNSLIVSNSQNEYKSVTAGSFNATSDARLKENFQPLISEKSILDLPTYKFDFINGSKNQIGCKAQDLQEICPEIVNEGDDGYLSIQESKIVYLLLEEVKKLRREIDELRGK